jgi:hypothetical protein
MTNVNKPRVKIFSGKVKIINIGFINTFINPKITEAINKSFN